MRAKPSAVRYPAISSQVRTYPAPGAGSLQGHDIIEAETGLPGQLAPSVRCGTVEGWEWCGGEECKKHPRVYRCGRLGCATCYPTASKRAGERIEERLLGIVAGYGRLSPPVKYGRVRHIEISAPQDENPSYEDARAFIRSIATDDWGGVLVHHVARKKHADDGTACERKRCKRAHVWARGPHFHFIGWGAFRSSRRVHETTGWVYVDIGAKRGDFGARSIAQTASYLMTHATVEYVTKRHRVQEVRVDGAPLYEDRPGVRGQTYRYVGAFANNRAKLHELESVPEPALCRCCEAPLMQYYGSANGPPCAGDEPHAAVLRYVRHVSYIIKPPRKKEREKHANDNS
jgi:hypothetical protein